MRRILPEQVPFAEGLSNQRITTLLVTAAVIFSVVGFGFVASAGAVGTADDTEAAQEDVLTQATVDSTDDFLLEYANNAGNSATIEGNGALAAVSDFRDGDLGPSELFAVVDFFRSGEPLLEVQFNDQDSLSGETVTIDNVSVADLDDDGSPNEFIVAVENSTGSVLAESTVRSGDNSIELDGLDLDIETGDDSVNLTAAIYDVDAGNRGATYQVQGDRIEQTAEVDPVTPGQFIINTDESELDKQVTIGEDASVEIAVDAITGTEINGTLDISQVDGDYNDSRNLTASQTETINETFTIPTADLNASETFEFQVNVTTDTNLETPLGPTEVTGNVTVTAGELNGTVIASGLTDNTVGGGEGIEDATIEIYANQNSDGGDPDFTFENATNQNGSYDLVTVPSGDHFVVADADDFSPEGANVSVSLDTPTTQDFELNYSDTGSISGDVALDFSAPDEDVNITVEITDDTETIGTETIRLNGSEDTATYTFDGLDVDVDNGYTVTATTDTSTYNDTTVENVTVDVGAETEQDLTLERVTGTVSGQVVASGDTDFGASQVPEGEGIEDATIEIYPFNTSGDNTPVEFDDATDADGNFTVEVPIGTHGIAADATDFSASAPTSTGAVEEGNETDVGEIALDYADVGSINGTITLAQPAPAGGISVTVTPDTADTSATLTFPEGVEERTYTLGNLPVQVGDGFDVTAGTDDFADQTESGVIVEPGKTTPNVDFEFSFLAFNDQATNSSQLNSGDRTGPAVVVEDVGGTEASTLLVTFENETGSTIVAGVENLTESELSGSNVAVPIDNTTGFPGDHTARLVPDADRSGAYAPGDVLSGNTTDAVVASETATIYQGTVDIEAQSFDSATSQVEINTSNLVPNDDYVIVVHETNSNGAPSAKIGNSSDLNGQANNVTVQLNDGEEINETADIAAMLHFASDDGPFGPPVRNADTSGFVGGNVVDVAEVEITATFNVTIDNTTSPVAEGENLNVNVTVENVGGQEETQTINLTEFNGNAIGENASEKDVKLGIGENETIELTFPTESGDGGTGDIVVESEDDSDRQNVTVTTDAFFDVSITNVTDPVNAGENITVRYEVENTGDNPDTQDVTFLIDNTQEGINSGVSLASGEAINDASFSFATDSNRTDNVALAVNSNNDTETRAVEVISQSNFDVSINSVNDPVFEGDDLVVNVTVENTGDRTDTQTINLTGFDGAVQDSRSLDGGENVTFELTLPTEEGDGSADSQEISVTSEDDVATESVTVDRPAFFDVSITSVSPNPVAAGEDVTVEYEVENTGTVNGTQDIVFEVVNETIDVNENLSLDGGNSRSTLKFTYTSNQSDIDRSPITVRVLSDDDVDSRTVEVNEPANFNVSGFTVDENPVFENQAYNVSATVTNTGGVTASQDIEYRLGGVENATSSVSLDPGNSTTVEFSLDEPNVTVDNSSEFEHGVFSADDNATGTLPVEPFDDADFNITVFDTDEQISQGENLTIDEVTVENEGNATATQDIEFNVTQDGSENVSVTLVENVTLEGEDIDGTGGESNTTTDVTVDTSGLNTGDYNQTVSTLNDSSEANLTVIQGTTFDVRGLNISGQDAPAEVDSGASPSEIRFTVENTGDRSGSATIDLNVSIDGEPVIEDTTTTDVSLTPGDTIETEFKNVDLGSLDPDGYTVEVNTDDDSVSGDLTVDGLAVRDLDIDNQNATATVREDNNFAVNATIENTGFGEKTQDIVLNITADNSGTLVANESSEVNTLSGGNTAAVNFTGLNLDVGTSPEDFTVTVSSQNETTEGDLTIEPLNFAVDITGVDVQNNEIEIDEGPTQVDITLDNQADQQLNRTLELEVVDNETGNATDVSNSREITLNANDVLTTSLELNTGELVNGNYTINATTETDEDSVAFDVNPANVSNLDQVEGFETLEAALGNVSNGETLRIDDVTLDSEPDNLTLSNNNVRIFGQGATPSSVSTDLNVTGDENTLENFTIEGNLTLNGANNNADNVTVTGPGSITNAGLSPDQASSGNVFVNDDATLNGVTADELVVASGATAEVSDTTAQTVSNNGTVNLGNNVANLSSGGVFSSIQAAVGNAGSDDTVTVQPGTYEESVTIDVEGLTLEGPNAGRPGDSDARGAEAVITGGSGNTPGVQIVADNVTLDGLQVENTDTNGIRFGPDTVPSNVTIQNSVVTDVTGAVGGKGAGNGIQFQFSNVANETAQNIQILDNEISNIATPNATNAETIATGVNVLPRGNNVDLEVDGNRFSEITAGSSGVSAEARGVSLDTQDDNENGFGRVDGAVVSNNTFNDITAPGVVRAVALFEDTSLAPREGPVNVSVTRNNFTNLSGAFQNTTGAVFVGGYETLGTTVVTENNFESGGVLRFAENQPGFTPANAEDLDATRNWWGNQSGPSGAGPGVGNPVSENVTFDPWLNAQFPAGQPVTDGDIDVRDYVADNETVAGGTLNASATVENGLQGVTTNQGRALTVEHVLLANGNRTVLNSTSVDVVPGTTETVSFVNSPIPDSVSSDSDAEHRIAVRDEFVNQSLVIEPTSGVSFNDQVLGTNANGSDAVLVEDVSTSDDATVVVTYEDSGDLVIAGLTEIQSNNLGSEDVTVVIENTGGFPGEHVAHLIPTSDLSTNYSAGDTVSNATADSILDSETATVFDGSVTIDDQSFVGSTDEITVDSSDLQADGPAEYRIVVHDQTRANSSNVRPAPSDVGPPLGSSDVLNGSESDVTIDLGQNITSTQDVLVMIHFPNVGGDSPGPAIPVLNGSAFGFGDGQSGTITDTATVEINEPANFTVTDLDPVDATVGVGDEFNVSANVTNTGAVEDTQEIELRLEPDGEAVANETVTLDSGETSPVTFENVSVDQTGEFNHTVASEDDVATGDLTVIEASVTINDQQATTQAGNVTVAEASASVEYVIAIHEDAVDGDEDLTFDIRGVSEVFNASEIAQNVEIDVDPAFTQSQEITAMLHTVNESAENNLGQAIGVSQFVDTANLTIEELTPAKFTVTIDSVPSSVTAGDDIQVNYTVKNVGDQQGTQDINFSVNGTNEGTQSDVTLNGSETFSDSFTSTTGDGDTPEVTVAVSSANDTASETVTVEELTPANFAVSINDAASETDVTAGEDAVINATIENTGDETATQTIDFTVDGSDEGNVEVTNLAGGASEDVEFTYTTEAADDGATAEVASDDDTDSTQLTVTDPANFTVSINDAASTTDVTAGEDAVINATIENTGDEAATQTIDFTVNGSDEGNVEVTNLAGGASEDVEFTYTTEAADDGATAEVASDDDTATRTLTVTEPANFAVTIDSVPSSVTAGDDIQVNYTVENVGDQQGTQDINFSVNGTDEGTELDVTLNGSETFSDSFTSTTGDGDTPEVTVAVSSANDTASETVTVEEQVGAGDFTVAIVDQQNATIAGENQTFDVKIENVGSEIGQQDIELDWGNGTYTNTTSVTLDAGNSTVETLSVTTDSDEFLGEDDVSVESLNDTATIGAQIIPERIISTDSAAPGDTVSVTVRGELDSSKNLSLIETFNRTAGDSADAFPPATYNGSGFSPTVNSFDSNGGVYTAFAGDFPESGSATLEFNYEITLPSGAAGEAFGFENDSSVFEIEGTAFTIGGDDAIAIVASGSGTTQSTAVVAAP